MIEPQPHVPLKVCWKCKRQKKLNSLPSFLCRKGSLRGPLLPSRIRPSTRRLRQRRCSRCILLLSLAEDGLETMELQAGEVSSAQLPCALLLLLLTAYICFQPMTFTFFWKRLGGCNKSCHRLDFNL